MPENVEDLYSEVVGPDGVTNYLPKREKIRELVSLRSQYTSEIIREGGNVYQASLDIQDIFFNFISTAPVLAQSAIIDVYTQEIEAYAQKIKDETDQLNAQRINDEKTAHHVGECIGVIILMLFIFFIFGSLK